MVETEKRKYTPFHAVNEFMRDDYRLVILQEVISQLEQCTPDHKQMLNKLIDKGVQIAGFRKSSQAPAALKVKNSPGLFEKSADFSALVMECWCELHPELKQLVGGVLKEKDWKFPEISEKRLKLPGFQLDWPKTDTFEVLIQEVRKLKPDMAESDDDISLMVVWVGNRLPYNLFDSDETTD